jgi:Cd2+/Zn2+-exporting ATPase
MNANPKETVLTITDLCCSAEEMKIRRKLEPIAGIQSLSFNIVSHKLTVRHATDEKKILSALKDIGLPGYVDEKPLDSSDLKAPAGLLLTVVISGALWELGSLISFFNAPPALSQTLFIASMVLGGAQIVKKAFLSLKSFSLDINFLMAIAAIGAALIGRYGEGAAVVVLYSLSLLLESMSFIRSRKALRSLMNLSPAAARVRRNGKEESVPVAQVAVGEVFVVRPGERIALDGNVTAGFSTVNQAPITGESMPVTKNVGDAVFAGTFNRQGALEVRSTRPASDTTLSRIIHLVEEAQSAKAPSQTFVERFARYYTPAIFILAIGVATIPPLLLGAPFGDWFYRSLVLLVISCPCAFVISTPVTVVSALTAAAQHGILVKGGKHLEKLAEVRAVAFDKTGTLTHGRPSVTDIVSLNSLSRTEILRITATSELLSQHPLADALLRKADEEGILLGNNTPEAFVSLEGKGIRTTVGGKQYIVGNHQLIEEMGVCSPEVERILSGYERDGKTVVILASEQEVLGLVAIADELRSEGTSTVDALHALGVQHVALFTGDNSGSAQAAARQLGVDEVRSEMLPGEKLKAVERLKEKFQTVAMVGDGVNDAPALAAADVGIAMGATGSDTSLETADVVLMSDDISKIPYAIGLGKKTVSVIRQNVALALVTKLTFIVLGVFGMTSLWLAILADDGATLLVILNGLRLLRKR